MHILQSVKSSKVVVHKYSKGISVCIIINDNIRTYIAGSIIFLKLAKTEDKLLSTEKRVDNLEKMWIRLLQTNTELHAYTVESYEFY